MPTTPNKKDGLHSNQAIRSMDKNQLVTYAISVTNNYRNLHTKLFDPQNGEITKLRNDLSAALQTNNYLIGRITNLEKQCISNAQYSRKETIELYLVFPKPSMSRKSKVPYAICSTRSRMQIPLHTRLTTYKPATNSKTPRKSFVGLSAGNVCVRW